MSIIVQKMKSLLWEGKTDWKNYRIIVKRIIEQYFKQSNYLKIDELPDMKDDFGYLEAVKEVIVDGKYEKY